MSRKGSLAGERLTRSRYQLGNREACQTEFFVGSGVTPFVEAVEGTVGPDGQVAVGTGARLQSAGQWPGAPAVETRPDGEVSPQATDELLAMGELASSRMVAAAFIGQKIPAAWVDSRKVLVTDNEAEFRRVAGLVVENWIHR